MRLGPFVVVVAVVAALVAAALLSFGVPATRLGVAAFAVGAGAVAALLAMWLVRRDLMQPLEELVTAAESVAPESLHARLEVDTNDEEVERLRDELNDALERIEAGYRAQESFISNVSHELKTPIAVLLTEAQVVRSGDVDPERAREFAESVEEEMRHLGRLVESFLTLTRADQGERLTRRVPVEWNDVVLDAVRHVEPVSSLHRVRVVPRLAMPEEGAADEEDVERLGDPELLQTMIENLVRNAVRFSPPDERVTVELSRPGGGLAIEVRDHGPGIPEELLPTLFDRFVQAEGERTRGSGLGLAIARRVAELHGGTIDAENVADGGCRFTARFPARADGPVEAGEEARS